MKNALLLFLASLLGITLSAQTACDSVTTSVRYYAFNDSLIEVTAYNSSHSFYSYPGFIVYNNNGDTVAKEDVNFFGLGTPSVHQLRIRPGSVVNNTFNGMLQLWTNFYDSLSCSYQKTFKLCPDSCVKVYPNLANFGGAISYGNVHWELKNSAMQSMGSGTLTLDTLHQAAGDSVCILPGSYTLYITPGTVNMGGGPMVGINTNAQYYAPQLYAPYAGVATQIPFNFFKSCTGPASVPQSIANVPGILVYAFGGKVYISSTKGKEIGTIMVYSVEGKVLYSGTTKEKEFVADLAGTANGVYMVRVVNSEGLVLERVFLGL